MSCCRAFRARCDGPQTTWRQAQPKQAAEAAQVASEGEGKGKGEDKRNGKGEGKGDGKGKVSRGKGKVSRSSKVSRRFRIVERGHVSHAW